MLGVVAMARADDAVVLSSTAPEFVPGAVVTDGEALRLPERTSLTLLFRSGEMLRLRGPVDKSLAQLRDSSRATSLQALAAALRVSGVDAAVIGGTRTAGRQLTEEDDVMVALEQTATYCLGPSATLWLSRATTGPQLVGFQRAGTLREVRFPEAANRIEWPADVLIEDGDRITFVSNAGAPLGAATFRKIEAKSDLEWLAQAGLLGCTTQFRSARRELEARNLLPD
ncbi:MAG TPA: hypothetical protein VHM01_15960 [Alphaproteobacteria bacterium]|nr:hypothetical protein [Alphaproteobacteria bacterium]